MNILGYDYKIEINYLIILGKPDNECQDKFLNKNKIIVYFYIHIIFTI